MEFIPADDVFEVERILKKRTHPTRGALYYVKWKNFPPSANTWEPPSNFSHKLINDFEKKHCRKLKQRPPPVIQGQTFYVEHHHNSTTTTATTTSSKTASNQHTNTSLYSTITNNNDTSSLSSSSTVSVSGSSSSATRSPDPLESPFQLLPTAQSSSKPKKSKRTSNLSRQQQVQLQMHIEQRQKGAQTGLGQGFAVFNSVTCNLPTAGGGGASNSVSLQHKLTKEPIIVTDVVTRNFSVTISECSTPEGFFRSPS